MSTPRHTISPAPTEEEAAAIAAVLAVLESERAAAIAARATRDRERLDVWVAASRRSAQRAGLQRGPWRLSGRIGRRSRV